MTSTSVIQKKDDSTSGTSHSLMVTRERLPCSTPFSTCSWDCSTWLYEKGLRSPWCHTHPVENWSHVYHSTYGWGAWLSLLLPCLRERTWGIGPFRVITQQYVLSFKKPKTRGQSCKHIQSWMSKHPVFCSLLQRLHDDHRFSPDPFGAFAESKVLLQKAKKQTIRELSRKTPDSIGAKLVIASKALRAYRNRHLGTLMRCCEAWKPIEDKIALIRFPLNVLTSRGSARSLQTLLVKILRNAKLRPRISLGQRQKKTLLWPVAEVEQRAWRNKKPVLSLSAVTGEEGHPHGKRRWIRKKTLWVLGTHFPSTCGRPETSPAWRYFEICSTSSRWHPLDHWSGWVWRSPCFEERFGSWARWYSIWCLQVCWWPWFEVPLSCL